jgi:hypothetical protein
MRFEKDYFLEDYIDIDYQYNKSMNITYDTLTHQSLEKYLNGDVNIIIKGKKINKYAFKDEWYLLRGCHIITFFNYGNYIVYKVGWKSYEAQDSVHLRRKIKIKMLMEQHPIHENV